MSKYYAIQVADGRLISAASWPYVSNEMKLTFKTACLDRAKLRNHQSFEVLWTLAHNGIKPWQSGVGSQVLQKDPATAKIAFKYGGRKLEQLYGRQMS